MDAIDTMLKAADALNSTRRNLMGLAELCMAMDTMTGEDIWCALQLRHLLRRADTGAR